MRTYRIPSSLLNIIFLALCFSFSSYAVQRTSITLAAGNWPPYSFLSEENNAVSGLSADIIKNVLSNMGVSISQNHIYPWARAELEVFNGNIDAVYTASFNEQRSQHCYFPDEAVIESEWVIFVTEKNKSQLPFTRLEDLANKSIGLVRGYNYPKRFTVFINENAKLQYATDEIQNINKLIHQRFDYMPAVKETILYLATHNETLLKHQTLSKLYVLPKPIQRAKFYLMFSKKNVSEAFVQQFSLALKQFKQTDKYQQLKQKYLSL